MITNPVAPFFEYLSTLWTYFPLTIRLVIYVVFGVILLFAVIKSLRGI